MPLDAPKEASQGWDIPTLKNGFQSLDKEQQGILGLFCRVYFVRLLILDDDEFYTRESVMTLGQQRAIATALNSLVFNQLMLSNSGYPQIIIPPPPPCPISSLMDFIPG